MRLTSASHHFSFAVSISDTTSRMERIASSDRPSSAPALAKQDKYHGRNALAPVGRKAAIPDVIKSTASEAFPVRTERHPCIETACAFQNNASFSLVKVTSS